MFWEPLSPEVGHPNSQFSLLIVCLDLVCVCVYLYKVKGSAEQERTELPDIQSAQLKQEAINKIKIRVKPFITYCDIISKRTNLETASTPSPLHCAPWNECRPGSVSLLREPHTQGSCSFMAPIVLWIMYKHDQMCI